MRLRRQHHHPAAGAQPPAGAEERAERTLTGASCASRSWPGSLARRYSKDEILELYLNETYYGNMAYGVEAAAQAYFGKHVRDLDLAECALLAGLPQAPAVYNPLENLGRPGAPDGRARPDGQAGLHRAEQARLARQEKLYFAVGRLFPSARPTL